MVTYYLVNSNETSDYMVQCEAVSSTQITASIVRTVITSAVLKADVIT